MEKYEKVPDIITGKDLDYLKDMFNWNFGAFKNTYEAINLINDKALKNYLKTCNKMFDSNMNNILNVLNNGEAK